MRAPLATIFSAACLTLPLAAGCASTSVSPDRVAEPKARIAAAEEAGAEENPTAALHLKLARDQYDHANKLIKNGDEERARRMLDRATVDAELALELARRDDTRKGAGDAMKAIDTLRKEHRMLQAN
ncbi:MAG: DUF4398 domain-containing protein [Myxococcota bacterium]